MVKLQIKKRVDIKCFMKKAMVLTAGYATRLRPLSLEVPKAYLPVLGRPVIHHIFDWLKKYGISEICINLHHLPEKMEEVARQYTASDVKFYFSREKDEILITAGALYPFKKILSTNGTFLLVNGKILTDINLDEVYEYHKRSGNSATLVIVENKRREPFSHVEIDGQGNIMGFKTFAEAQDQERLFVFTGIHLLEPEVFDFIPGPVPWDTVRHMYPAMMKTGLKIGYWLSSGRWYEFSTLERFLVNNLVLLKEKGMSCMLSPDTTSASGSKLSEVITVGKVSIGNDCSVQKTIFMGDNYIGSNCEFMECILGPRVKVPAGTICKRCLLTNPYSKIGSEQGTVANVIYTYF